MILVETSSSHPFSLRCSHSPSSYTAAAKSPTSVAPSSGSHLYSSYPHVAACVGADRRWLCLPAVDLAALTVGIDTPDSQEKKNLGWETAVCCMMGLEDIVGEGVVLEGARVTAGVAVADVVVVTIQEVVM